MCTCVICFYIYLVVFSICIYFECYCLLKITDGSARRFVEGVFAVDMKKHYLGTREKYRAERIKEAMLAWVKSVPMAHCSLPVIEKIA